MPRGDASVDRLLAAALRLFAAHGVAGTSLQMIADELGVTKAAVYHHFRTKDSITLAALMPAFVDVEALVTGVQSVRPGAARQVALVDGLAEQAVRHRERYVVLLQDVSVPTLVSTDPHLVDVFARLREELAGPKASDSATLRASMFLSGLVAPATDTQLSGMTDEALRRGIAEAGYRLLGLDGRAGGS